MTRKLILILLVLFTFVGTMATVHAIGAFGVLSGKVADKETGKPIDNVFITAKGSPGTFTAITDSSGFFSIAGVPIGTYDVAAERVGYQTTTFTGILVTGDATTNVQFNISGQAVQVTGVTVTAARAPVVNPRQTMTNYSYSNQEIKEVFPGPANLSLTTIYEFLPGVQTGYDSYYGLASPHIRGGTGSDIGYAFDGIPTYETITDTFGSNLTNVGTQRTDFYVGGYPAQYGNFISGFVNQIVPRGSGPIHGNIEFQTGFWLDNGARLPSYDTATGTVPTYNGQAAYNPTNINIELQGRDRRWSYYLNHIIQDQGLTTYPSGVDIKPFVFESGNAMIYSQQLRDTVFNNVYDLNNYNSLQFLYYTGIGKFNFEGFQELACNPADAFYVAGQCKGTNTATGFGEAYNAFATTPLNDSHEIQFQDIEKLEWTHRFKKPGSVMNLRLWRYNTGVFFNLFDLPSTFWEYRRSATKGVLLDHQNQITSEHLLDVGGSYSYSSNWLYSSSSNINAPSTDPTSHFNPVQMVLFNAASYAANLTPGNLGVLNVPDTQNIAVWASDEWRPSPKWVVNAGLRWDRENYLLLTGPGITTAANGLPLPVLAPISICGAAAILVSSCPDSARFNPSLISPRMGASYKLSNKLTMKASWGKFVTFAPSRRVDAVNLRPSGAILARQAGGSKTQVGENIDVSWEYALDDNTYVKLTPYIKHVRDPLQSVTVQGIPVFSNGGTLESRGIELLLKTRDWHNLSGWLAYTYSNTRASQVPFEADLESALIGVPGAQSLAQMVADNNVMVPTSYDQRHIANLVLNYKVPGGHWEISPNFQYGSGYPYGIGAQNLHALNELLTALSPVNSPASSVSTFNGAVGTCNVAGQPACNATIASSFPNPLGETTRNSLRTPAWWLGNIAITYHFNDNVSAILNVNNMFNNNAIFSNDNQTNGSSYVEVNNPNTCNAANLAAAGQSGCYSSQDTTKNILPQYNPLKGQYAPGGFPSLREFFLTLQYKY